MATIITGIGPDTIGQVASFHLELSPAELAIGTPVASELVVTVYPPDEAPSYDDSEGASSPTTNVWDYVASTPVDVSGSWVWRVETRGTLVTSFELTTFVADSPAEG